MKKEIETNSLYVRNVIMPLEEMTKKMKLSGDVSNENLKKFDKLLLEKYLTLEKILKEESSKNIEK